MISKMPLHSVIINDLIASSHILFIVRPSFAVLDLESEEEPALTLRVI